MKMIELILFVILLGLVTYRVSRFIVLDSLIDAQRDWAFAKLETRTSWWAEKLYELITCPYCITIWVAAGATVATRMFVGSFPMPVWVWLGAATVSLVAWRIVDPE